MDHFLYRDGALYAEDVPVAEIAASVGSPFYVYQYATSKAAASLVHNRMTEGDIEAREATVARYLELLRSGGSDHPIALLQKAGIDFATTEPVDALVATMNRLVDDLEQELEIIKL